MRLERGCVAMTCACPQEEPNLWRARPAPKFFTALPRQARTVVLHVQRHVWPSTAESAARVPDMGSERAARTSVSSMVEHQTEDLAVAGSNPVPSKSAHHRLDTTTLETLSEQAGGRWSSARSAVVEGLVAAAPSTRVGASRCVDRRSWRRADRNGSTTERLAVHGFRHRRQLAIGSGRQVLPSITYRWRRHGEKLFERQTAGDGSSDTPRSRV